MERREFGGEGKVSLIRLFARWRERRQRIRADAADLVRAHSGQAYEIAKRMASAERTGRLISPSLPRGHWERVRREVRRAG